MQGREQLAPEQAGPTQTGQAIPQEMVRGAPNVQGAYDFAASASNPALQAAGLRKLKEGPMKVGAEDVLLDPVTMQPIFKGAGKTTSEMQNYNFAKTPEGGGFKGSFTDFKNEVTPYQQQRLSLDRERFEFDKSQKGAGKDLTESQGKASAFQSQMVSASNAVNTLEGQGFDPTSFKSQTAVKLAGGLLTQQFLLLHSNINKHKINGLKPIYALKRVLPQLSLKLYETTVHSFLYLVINLNKLLKKLLQGNRPSEILVLPQVVVQI
jgi:hypothetical protein